MQPLLPAVELPLATASVQQLSIDFVPDAHEDDDDEVVMQGDVAPPLPI